MKVALIQCPAWITDSPPYALALLGSSLKNNGHEVMCFDFNIELFHLNITEKKSNKRICNDSWNNFKIENDWRDYEKVKEFIVRHKSIIDKIIDEIFMANSPVIGFSVHDTSAIFSYEITKIIKAKDPGKIILWGGPYCFRPYGQINIIRTMKPEIDGVCQGDGHNSLPYILSHYEQHNFFPETEDYYFNPNGSGIGRHFNINMPSENADFPFADYSLFRQENYSWSFLPILISRGCVNRCTFCNEYTCWPKYYFRSPEKVINEIKYQKKQHPEIKTIWLSCSNLSGSISGLKSLCELFIKENAVVDWHSQLAIRKELTSDVLKKMKESGCQYLHYGLESGSNHVLKLMNKGYDRKTAAKVLRNTVRSGIWFNFNIIVGFPGETIFDFLETLFFIKYFTKYGIRPSIATCHVVHNSLLYNNFSDYRILYHNTPGWETIDSGNTLRTRKLRMHFTRQLYNSKFLNLFYLPYYFLKLNEWSVNKSEVEPAGKNKHSLAKSHKSKIHKFYFIFRITFYINLALSYVIFYFSYIFFFLWIAYTTIILTASEIVSKIQNFYFKNKRNVRNAEENKQNSESLKNKIFDKIRAQLITSSTLNNPVILANYESDIKKFDAVLLRFKNDINYNKMLLDLLKIPPGILANEICNNSEELLYERAKSYIEKL